MSSSTTPPSSRGPAGVPSSGNNGMYIGVAVVLLLSVVGVGIWKFSAKPETDRISPVASASASASAVPTQDQDSKLDDVPAPPPVESAKPANAPAATAAAATGSLGCGEHNCKGTMTPELERGLGVRARAARRCYEAELKNDPSLQGKMSVNLRIGSNGAVCSSQVTQTDVPAITACVERIFRTNGTMPAPKGGCLDANVPMSFVPSH